MKEIKCAHCPRIIEKNEERYSFKVKLIGLFYNNDKSNKVPLENFDL